MKKIIVVFIILSVLCAIAYAKMQIDIGVGVESYDLTEVPGVGDMLLLENGDYLLLENDDKLLLE